jgi:hypothetical protein
MKVNILSLSKKTAGFAAALLTGIVLLTGTNVHAQISTATVTVNGAIAAPTSVSSSTGSLAICNGVTATLTQSGGNLGSDGAYKWYTGSCGGTLIGSGATLPVTVTSDSVIYVRVESAICGSTTCDTVHITLNPTPTVTTTLANLIGCYNAAHGAITLAGTPGGAAFNISGGASVGIPDATGVASIAAFNYANATNDTLLRTITVTPTANGCTGTPRTFTVNTFPNVQFAATTADTVICNGLALNVTPFTSIVNTVSPAGTVAYNWTNDGTSIGLGASGTGNISIATAHNGSTADTTANIIVTPVYTVNGNSCSGANDTFSIMVHPTPNGTLNIATTICSGSATPLTFNATSGTNNGPWSLNIGANSTVTTTTYNGVTNGGTVTVSPTANTTYNLMKITDAKGCINQ